MSSDPNIPFLLSSRQSDDEHPDLQEEGEDNLGMIRARMEKWKQDDKDYYAHVGKRYSQKALTQLVSFGVNHFTFGLGSVVIKAVSWASTLLKSQRLSNLQKDPECPAGKPEICSGLLAFAINQKERQLADNSLTMIPILGTMVSAANKANNIAKRIEGNAGEYRAAAAVLLVSHANEGCSIASAIFVELVCGDYTKKSNWREGLALLESSRAVDRAKAALSCTS